MVKAPDTRVTLKVTKETRAKLKVAVAIKQQSIDEWISDKADEEIKTKGLKVKS